MKSSLGAFSSAVLGAVLLALTGLPLRAAEPSAVGLWQQIDERTGKPESRFRISENNGIYEGILVEIFFKPDEDPNFVCDKCEGKEKGRLLGLALIKGMHRNGLKYENGKILDPRDGTTYRAMMTLSSDGQTLAVRGTDGYYVMPNRGQNWKRLPEHMPVMPAGK